MLDAAARYARTVRHLRREQVLGRLGAGLKRRLALKRLPSAPDRFPSVGLRPAVPFLHHDPWNTAEELRRGRFRFLNETQDLEFPPDWNADEMPLLWRFNLHYFRYLHLLEPSERVAICRDWVRNNHPGLTVAWHPYPTSVRIAGWCKSALSDQELLASLYRQSAFLAQNIETDLQGNHLLENARALVLAGTFFDGSEEGPRWLRRGLDLYREQSPEQILPDGGHFERSPMYHAIVLEGFLDVFNVLPPDHPDRAWMAEAHAHADLLSYELSFGGARLVVDSGVYDYEAGPMRTYVRGTQAHNTVCVEGVDQVECWGRFRVARRSEPRDVSSWHEGGVSTFRGCFDGYSRLIGDGIVLRRILECDDTGARVLVRDAIDGTGRHDVVSRLHLHPDVQVEPEAGGYTLRSGEQEIRFRAEADVSVESGWYCPEFGKRMRNAVLAVGGKYDLPVVLEYSLTG